MKQSVVVIFTGVILLSCAAVAGVPISAAQKSAVCAMRSACTVTAIHRAGNASVAEIHLGIRERIDEAGQNGCIVGDGDKKDGGTEYWLLDARPVRLLTLCNDGYGAAGVGDDQVAFQNNRMTHEQEGGSAWRWTTKDVYSLIPFRLLTTETCSFNALGSETGTVTFADQVKFWTISVAKNPSAHWTEDDGVGCPDVTPTMFASPRPYPGPKLVTAFPVPTPHNGEIDFGVIPSGSTLGSCSLRLSTDGNHGFLVFGQPAAAGDVAEIRVLSPTSKSLMAEIYDPVAAPAPKGKTWIAGAHLEVWGGGSEGSGQLTHGNLSQIAIDLNGTVHARGKADVPYVEHWRGEDEKGRHVAVLLMRWSNVSGYAVGKAFSYSQAQKGRQVRMVSTTPIVHGVPVFIPSTGGMEAKCAIRAGRLMVD